MIFLGFLSFKYQSPILTSVTLNIHLGIWHNGSLISEYIKLWHLVLPNSFSLHKAALFMLLLSDKFSTVQLRRLPKLQLIIFLISYLTDQCHIIGIQYALANSIFGCVLIHDAKMNLDETLLQLGIQSSLYSEFLHLLPPFHVFCNLSIVIWAALSSQSFPDQLLGYPMVRFPQAKIKKHYATSFLQNFP